MIHTKEKKFILLFIVLIFFMGIVFKERVSLFVWNVTRIPQAALFINADTQLAHSIGEYYFNAEGSGVYDVIKAEKYFKIALEYDPSHMFAKHQLARIEFLRGDFDDALVTINEQINEHGDEVIASYYVRGLIYGFAGELEKAESDFLTFIEQKPKNWGGYNDLAWIYFQKGDYKKSREYALLGLEVSPHNAWLLTTYGVSLINLERRDEAREALQKALEIAKNMTPDHWSNTNPGNNPSIAEEGLALMLGIIEKNLELVVDK